MSRTVVAVVWLTAAWLAFWRDISAANVISGVALSALLLGLFPYDEPRQRLRVRPVPLLQFMAVFAWSVLKANAVVALEVVTPRNRISEGIVAVPLRTDQPIVVTIVSHAIILAPGTMVIDIEHEPSIVLYVHALHLRSPQALRHEVRRLESLALAAFGGTHRRLPDGAVS